MSEKFILLNIHNFRHFDIWACASNVRTLWLLMMMPLRFVVCFSFRLVDDFGIDFCTVPCVMGAIFWSHNCKFYAILCIWNVFQTFHSLDIDVDAFVCWFVASRDLERHRVIEWEQRQQWKRTSHNIRIFSTNSLRMCITSNIFEFAFSISLRVSVCECVFIFVTFRLLSTFEIVQLPLPL